jgi:DedD protein
MPGLSGGGSKEPAAKAEAANPHADTKSAVVGKDAEPSKDGKTAAHEVAKAPAHDAAGAYVIQVAALADEARVKQLQKQMSAAGVRPFTEAVSTKTGEMTRVRAGPYATREAAESARIQLRKAGLDGKVVPR